MVRMRVVGLTGGAGCGKSFVASVLTERFPIRAIYTDEIARRQMEPGGVSYEAVVAAFGRRILLPSGKIDRGLLAGWIFKDKKAKQLLNQLTHPMVRSEVLEEIQKCRESGTERAVLVETALLIEAGYREFCDEVWYVWTPEEERKKRLRQTRGYPPERIEEIFQSQASEKEFLSIADRVIQNREGTGPEELARQAAVILEQWKKEDY